MKKFNDFLSESTITESKMAELNEAKFSNDNLQKVSDLMAKIGSKKLGAKFSFAWKDKFKKASGESGIGVRYMSPEGKQIRFNHVYTKNSFAVNSVDYWAKGDTLTEPSMSIFFAEGVNIVQINDKLWTAIKTGKEPSVKYGEIRESVIGLDEAKMSPDERKRAAQDLGIPMSYAKSNGALLHKAEQMGLEQELKDYMSIKLNDSEKTEFATSVNASDTKLKDKNFYADPKYVFDDIRNATKVIAKGYWRSLIIAGMGGIGKTFGVKDVLTKELGPYSDGPDGKWAYYEGMKGLGMGFYITFLLNKKKIVVIDDSDSIWYKGNVNMMKIITSDSGDREPSWAGKSTANVALMTQEEREIYELQYIDKMMEDPNTTMKPPSKFRFEGQFINISNMKGDEFDAAIKSRSIFIDVYLAQRDVVRRMATIMGFEGADETEIMEVLTAIDPQAKDALEGTGRYAETPQYMTPEEARKNKTMNMRSVGITRALRAAGFPGWQRAAGLYS